MTSLKSGITVSSKLEEAFEACADKKTRWLKVQIVDEALDLVASGDATWKMSADFEDIQAALDDDAACFVLVRLEKRSAIRRNGVNFPLFLLVTYVPDSLKVKEKMVYASTVDSLKSTLGYRFIDDEFTVKDKSDCTWDEYQGYRSESTPKPYSNSELVQQRAREMEDQARMEQDVGIRTTGKIGGYHAVKIPMSTAVREALQDFKAGRTNFVHMSIDGKGKTLDLTGTAFVSQSELEDKVDTKEPAFYVWQWTSGAPSGTPVFFIYCCPDESPIRLRMPYSTTKPSVVESVESLGITIKTKMEIRSGSDLSESELKDQLSNKRTTWSSGSSSSGVYLNSSGGQYMGVQLRSTGLNTGAGSQPRTWGGSTSSSKSSSSSGGKKPAYMQWSEGLPGMSNTTGPKKKIVYAPEGAYG